MSLLEALNASYAAYLEHGPRSSKKLIPIHQYIATEIRRVVKSGSVVFSDLGDSKLRESGEVQVNGAYYPKNIDITAVTGPTQKTGKKQITLGEDATVDLCVGVKFVTSNYHQNKNNYFENMMGETANIQKAGIPYGQFIALPIEIPYFDSNKVLARMEKITGDELKQYVELAKDISEVHSPLFLAIKLIKIDFEHQHIEILNDNFMDSLLPDSSKYLSWDRALSDLPAKIAARH